ncbi:hypothetical protein SUGI_0999530 [Cryptomeria japonica]|nr:hypothetical protein SUGI_0999530 [Cryptomeria japonica]
MEISLLCGGYNMVVVGMSSKADGAISCSTVVSDLIPCLSYVSGSSAQPTKGCCNGIKTLNTAAKTRLIMMILNQNGSEMNTGTLKDHPKSC